LEEKQRIQKDEETSRKYLKNNATLTAEKKADFDNFFYAHSKSNTKFQGYYTC